MSIVMKNRLLFAGFACIAFFVLGYSSVFAQVVIGSGDTVNPNDFGPPPPPAPNPGIPNFDLDSTLSFVGGTGGGGNADYDTGAGFILVSSGTFTDSLGTGSGQVQWMGSGGFTGNDAVNLGGAAAPETLTWDYSGFVPTGSALVLNATDGFLYFDNPIGLGTDPTATRQIDVGGVVRYSQIAGAGNLLVQAYGSSLPHVLQSQSTTGTISVTGLLTVDNATVLGAIAAPSISLMNGASLNGPISGTPIMTLAGGSSWVIATGTTTSVNQLNSTDAQSFVGIGGATLEVDAGHFAGTIAGLTSTGGTTTGTLIKTSPGILALTGDNSSNVTSHFLGVSSSTHGYSGGTEITQGTLLADNTSGSATGIGQIIVEDGAALGGTGTVAPDALIPGDSDPVADVSRGLTVEDGGEINMDTFDPSVASSPSIGVLTVELGENSFTTSAIFDSGAKFVMDVGPGDSSDQVDFETSGVVEGTQVYFNNNEVDLDFLDGAGAGTYTIFDFGAPGEYTGELEGGPGLTFNYNATDITVTVTSVPEPSSDWCLGIGLIWLAGVSYWRAKMAFPRLTIL